MLTPRKGSRTSSPTDGGTDGEPDEGAEAAGHLSWGRLLLTGLALSVEVAATVIGVVGIACPSSGWNSGARIGENTGRRGELLGGVMLIGVGIAVAAGALRAGGVGRSRGRVMARVGP